MGRMTQPNNKISMYTDFDSEGGTVSVNLAETSNDGSWALDEATIAYGKTELGALRMAKRRIDILTRKLDKMIKKAERKAA